MPAYKNYKIDWYRDDGDEIYWDSLDNEDKEIIRNYLRGLFITNNVKSKNVSFVIIPKRKHVWYSFLTICIYTLLIHPIHEVLQEMRIGRQYILSRYKDDCYIINFVYESP